MLFMMLRKCEIRGEVPRNNNDRISTWKGFPLDEANKRRFSWHLCSWRGLSWEAGSELATVPPVRCTTTLQSKEPPFRLVLVENPLQPHLNDSAHPFLRGLATISIPLPELMQQKEYVKVMPAFPLFNAGSLLFRSVNLIRRNYIIAGKYPDALLKKIKLIARAYCCYLNFMTECNKMRREILV